MVNIYFRFALELQQKQHKLAYFSYQCAANSYELNSDKGHFIIYLVSYGKPFTMREEDCNLDSWGMLFLRGVRSIVLLRRVARSGLKLLVCAVM